LLLLLFLISFLVLGSVVVGAMDDVSSPAPSPSWTQGKYDWKQAGSATMPGPSSNKTVKTLFSSKSGGLFGGPLISPKTGELIFAAGSQLYGLDPKTGGITWAFTFPAHSDSFKFQQIVLDSKGNIFAASQIVSSVGWTLVQLSSDGKLQRNLSMPYVYSYASSYYPLLLVSPTDVLLIQNATSYYSGNTCQISNWNGPELGPCYDGFVLGMNDNGWLFTLETTSSSATINAYSSLAKTTTSWSYVVSSYYYSTFASVWNDQNLLLVSSSYTNTLDALTLQSGVLVWQFSYTNYPYGCSISPQGYALLYPTYTSYYTDAIGPDGYSLGRLPTLGGPVAVDSEGKFYGGDYYSAVGYSDKGEQLWETKLTYTPSSYVIGSDRTLFVMSPYALTSISE